MPDQVVGIFVHSYVDAKGYLRTPRIVLTIMNTYQICMYLSQLTLPFYCDVVSINVYLLFLFNTIILT